MAQGSGSGPRVMAVMDGTGTGRARTGVLPAAVVTTSSGVPLTEPDRWPSRDRIGAWARAAAPGIVFAHLTGDRALIGGRPARRPGHCVRREPPDSRPAGPEPLEPDEAGVTVDVPGTPAETAGRVVDALRAPERSAAPR
ncbi:gluconokinase [Streptomyces pilosus]